MKKSAVYTFVCFIIFLLLQNITEAQSFVDFSKYHGGSGADNVVKMQMDNGEIYIAGTTTSSNFPVTNGSTYRGSGDITVAKYAADGSLLFSIYLGGSGYDYFDEMQVINGDIYIFGESGSIDFPVTNGTIYHGDRDIIITKLNTNGNIIFSTYLGGNAEDILTQQSYLKVVGNEIFITGRTGSVDFPTTGGDQVSFYLGIGLYAQMPFFAKLDATNGSILKSEFFASPFSNIIYMEVQDGALYLIGNTPRNNLPLTIGNAPAIPLDHIYIRKLNSNSFDAVYERYISGSSQDFTYAAEIVNGELHITGSTISSDFPVTNNSVATSGLTNYNQDQFYTKLNIDGSIGFSTYLDHVVNGYSASIITD